MKICIVGTGYVGLVTGTCFAEVGNDVVCVDIDTTKIENLKKGILPIYEPGLDTLVEKNYKKGKLHFTTDLAQTIKDGYNIIFSAVGTPPDEDGSADLQYVINVAREVGRNMDDYTLIVTKSTVPVGTAAKVRKAMEEELEKRGVNIPFDVASNPEFLKEGAAVDDFLKPDRIVVGIESEKAADIMTKLYRPFTMNGHPVYFMDVPSAEMTKYAANSMLATRISFMNDIANLCERLGADVNNVRMGIGSDSRIGRPFLYPGVGYGGSCFPKDVKALIKTADENGYSMRVLKAVEEVNDDQKSVMIDKIKKHYNNNLSGKTVALWGLSFKPQTDDMREAPSLVMIQHLLEAGCKINAYDPVAMEESKRRIGNVIDYKKDIYETLENADFLLIVTEWKEFRMPDLAVLRDKIKDKVIFDGRNIFDADEIISEGFEYYCIGQRIEK